MKKTGILNREISDVVADLGHTDTIVVCDAGLPIPQDVRRIDISLVGGKPGLIETLETIALELEVEGCIMAAEVRDESPHILEAVKKVFPKATWQFVPHTEFKMQTHDAKAVIRTGEFTHYSNVILIAGVVF